MGVTKNRQSLETIQIMAAKAFPDQSIIELSELTEGLCNVAYLLLLDSGKKAILKIAPKDKHTLLTNEVNMMKAEIMAMQLSREHTDVPVAEVYLYDDTRMICDSEYFFMEVLEGQSYYSVKNTLTPEVICQVDYEIGRIEKAITSVKGNKFGLMGDAEHWADNLYDMTYRMLSGVLQDAMAKNIVIGFSSEEILAELTIDKNCFLEVTQAAFVHWDMWEGNIFIKDGHVCGIIDWERAMWGDALMDDRFRRHTRNDDFLKGYGQKDFSMEEIRRICWYDVFLYLTMMTEGAYREYEDDGQYQWVKPLFEASFCEVQNRI
ncbi:MAG: aminoglycoside phosphotransferase family protein [Mobilitalea sp.]